ncbi:MAG: Gfo/Idh/MocA family oxidoreductase [Calditrichaceae bacterium]|nr:Gfo/Idh/MocA family oxidoreductase [Calditrichaceae bacterium]
MRKVKWGVLSTAKIGTEKVIPAMQKGMFTEVTAIASRSLESAKHAANKLNIPKAYSSYEALVNDPGIEAVYIPLPNHLHVEWAEKCMKAGKHVLLEKPIGLNYKQAEHLLQISKKYSEIKIMEGFMYRHHPQMLEVKRLIDDGIIGEVRSTYSTFTYFNNNPKDIRNQPDIGGGGLLDIGCYCISLARFIFANEPKRVSGLIENDPHLRIDRLASGLLEFQEGYAGFMCSTQLQYQQYARVSGTKGMIEILKPFTPESDERAKIILLKDSNRKEITFDACDKYTIQSDLFSNAILNNQDSPLSIEDGVANMKVIEAVFLSAESGMMVKL